MSDVRKFLILCPIVNASFPRLIYQQLMHVFIIREGSTTYKAPTIFTAPLHSGMRSKIIHRSSLGSRSNVVSCLAPNGSTDLFSSFLRFADLPLSLASVRLLRFIVISCKFKANTWKHRKVEWDGEGNVQQRTRRQLVKGGWRDAIKCMQGQVKWREKVSVASP